MVSRRSGLCLVGHQGSEDGPGCLLDRPDGLGLTQVPFDPPLCTGCSSCMRCLWVCPADAFHYRTAWGQPPLTVPELEAPTDGE